MKREYIFVFVIVCIFIWFMRPVDHFKPDTLADLTRDQIHSVVQNKGFDCDSVILISRNRKNIKVGCDVLGGYKKYVVYKNDYGFNEVEAEK